MKIRYFDNAATTQTSDKVINSMIPYYNVNYGNPSSIYGLGRQSKKVIEDARDKISKVINAKSKEIFFTSCGTESDNLAIRGIAYKYKHKGKHIITSKIEHSAVLNTCKQLEKQGFNITYLNVNRFGKIDLNELERNITNDTILISIMFANNEIGTIEPIEEIGKIAKKHKIIFHTDAVQAIGNIRIDTQKFNIDLLSLSGHKFYGPKGIGALYVKENIDFESIMYGGHQEKNKRPGTENVAQIVGMTYAIEDIYSHLDEYNAHLKSLRDYFVLEIQKQIEQVYINGDNYDRLPGNINLKIKDINAEELLYKLDEVGICASSGSACSSNDDAPSHVLTAIGLSPNECKSSIRFSFGKHNTKEDIIFLIQYLVYQVNELRKKKE